MIWVADTNGSGLFFFFFFTRGGGLVGGVYSIILSNF